MNEVQFTLILRMLNPIKKWVAYNKTKPFNDDCWNLVSQEQQDCYLIGKSKEDIIEFVKNYKLCTNIKLK